ncbi:MAG: hypothetical protein A2017_18100 [Lentisphaerae bacterium GWF2_44_16]|nr:MAG: hypothetical protein A2017_18100 [Lentisphaerae bacterium GWF2_44_16]
MNETYAGIGAFVFLIIIVLGIIISILSILMPIFICLINSRVKELLREVKITNAVLAEFLKRLDNSK